LIRHEPLKKRTRGIIPNGPTKKKEDSAGEMCTGIALDESSSGHPRKRGCEGWGVGSRYSRLNG